MKRELQLLIQISQNEYISQRQLAKVLDLSLGTVNSLISQMIEQGFITTYQSSAKQVKYSLTEKGCIEKSKGQYDLIKKSFQTIIEVKSVIFKKIEEQIHNGIEAFYLFGEKNELYKLCKICLLELKKEYNIFYMDLNSISNIKQNPKICILYWNLEYKIENDLNAVLIL